MNSDRATKPRPRPANTASVLCVLVCHDGQEWLSEVLEAIARSRPRPLRVVAVDTGSVDDTAGLLEASAVVDEVLTLDRETGYAAAVHAGVAHARERWGDTAEWIWLLHDDTAPDPGCLGALLASAEPARSVGVLGPLQLDWTDRRLIVEAGLSTDASGHRQSGVLAADPGWASGGDAGFERDTEVLAVSSAGLLVRTEVWDELGGFDEYYRLFGEDIDLGWRANAADHLVLVVPAARIRHARAASRRVRDARLADRTSGMRTFLANTGTFGYLLGVPRLAVLAVLRALAFTLLARFADAGAELRALRGALGGGLRAARAARAHGDPRGLLTTRRRRLRAGLRAIVAALVRRGLAEPGALGRVTEQPNTAAPTVIPAEPRRQAIPASSVNYGKLAARRGPRLPANTVVVPREERPSPHPRDAPAPREDLVLVELSRAQVLRHVLLAPVLLLTVGLLAVALLANRDRLGIDLAGGRLLPVPDLAATWQEYFSGWHPVAGGTGGQAPAVLAVLGVLGAPFWFAGGPAVAVSLLLLLDFPLAGLTAYFAMRKLPAKRWIRALLAAGYALLPAATTAVAQGRLDAVGVHILLPLVLAGLRTVLLPEARIAGRANWLPATALCALGLAVLGAFSPLVYLLLLALGLVGFVVVPAAHGDARRRVGSLIVLVLLPVALLLPWPAVLVQHPGVLLHGIGANLGGAHATVTGLATLDPGGPGSFPLVGALVLFAALLAIVLRPGKWLASGLVVLVFGALGAIATAVFPVPGIDGGAPVRAWAGGPLLLAGAGAILMIARASAPGRMHWAASFRIAFAAAGALGVAALAASALTSGAQGPVRDGGGTRLAEAQQAELAATDTSVLVLGTHGQPTRLRAGDTPWFGDDDLPAVPSARQRLAEWSHTLRAPDPGTVRAFVGEATQAGVGYVVPADRQQAGQIRQAAPELLDQVRPSSDGRPVLRLRQASAPATLIAPALAKLAVTGGEPPARPEQNSVTTVASRPPEVAVRVAEGSRGRLLVVAAELEPGWRATIGDREAPLTKAWGHQVSVSVPENGADVRITYSSALRNVLLLVQGAAVLLTLLTAIPIRRR
ncbi:glycosyltransferase [Sciscionella sediminilitoris]|uniref:glycosyltransferase n=1 Tax=Sciscionella sediminilitoris TaxID=1445613 RepID=UPI0007C733AA|nr:glycosyltransferase [Sciscionella sp. SE31]